MQNLDLKIELWKKRLLDLGKSNRLINFKETKRSNIAIKSPCLGDLFNLLVNQEKSLEFSYPSKTIFDDDGEEQSILVVKGDIETNQTLNEQQRTLKSLRAKAKTSIEEQGINTLYLTFGMLNWRENKNSNITISSPIILVPASLKIESINEPYILSLRDDGILLNPSLAYKLENDFGVIFPEYNEHEDSIEKYLMKIVEIANENDWKVTEETFLALLSFLKMNMYEDLVKNKDKIVSNHIVKALAGDYSEIVQVPAGLNNYDHDKNIRPIETYQVVDADSSQQDAILLSKKGISFVLQGPPGTGKSQTITNIIAEAISDGKKVLFVSEKMAALDVVKDRIKEVKLDDFCLTLHSHKVNKKDILGQLERTLNTPKIKVHEDILYKLSELEEKRRKLINYNEELHTKCMLLNSSIYEINGKLAKLEDTEDVVFSIDDVDNTDGDKLNKYKFLIGEYAKNIGKKSMDYSENPWYGCNIQILTHELRHNIYVILMRLLPNYENFIETYEKIINITGAKFNISIENVKIVSDILNLSIKSSLFPSEWTNLDLNELIAISNSMTFKCNQYFDLSKQLKKKYDESIFEIPAIDIINNIEKEANEIKKHLDSEKFNSNKEIVVNAENIKLEFSKLNDILELCLKNSEIIAQHLGLRKPEDINSLLLLNELVGFILDDPKPSERWFNDVQLCDTIKILDDARNHQLTLNKSMLVVKTKFDERIFNINFDELLKKFNDKYKSTIRIIANFNNISQSENVNKKNISDFIQNQNYKLIKSINIIETAKETAQKISTFLGIKKIKTFEELISLSKLVGALNNNLHVTESWFDRNKDSILDKLINEIKQKQLENSELIDNISAEYNKEIFKINSIEILARFNTEYIGVFKNIKNKYKADKKKILSCSKVQHNKITDSEIIVLLNKISEIKENEEWLSDHNQTAKELLGELYQESYTNWELIEKSREKFNAIRDYFTNEPVPDLLKEIMLEYNYGCINDEYNNLVESKLNEASDELFNILSKDLVGTNIEEVLDFANDIYNNSIELNNDFSLIMEFKLNKDDLICINEIIELLKNIKNINSCKKWFKDKHYLLGEYLGSNYIGNETDFELINNNIEIINKIKLYFDNDKISDELVKSLTSSNYPYENIISYQWNVKKLIELKISERLDLVLLKKNNNSNNISDILKTIENVKNSITIINDKYNQITILSKDKTQYEIVMQDIASLNKIQKIEQMFLENNEELQNKFSFYYNGVSTDWNQVISKLEYFRQFVSICKQYSISESFINKVSHDDKITQILEGYMGNLINEKDTIYSDFDWFTHLFENPDLMYNQNIFEIYDKIEGCLNLSLLEDYIDFIGIRKQCIELGLGDFIEKVEELEIHSDNILNVFLKRFYKLWLDVVLPKYPAVFSFRSRNQQVLIDEFIKLDKMQLEIASLRIRERLISNIPNIDVTTSSLEEVGILKRELSKQRKIMPLRRLFNEIPNLLTTLKPCMMMSPLSVSMYLKADGYKFDLIIFDEASQICTEDAIGAIIRGKQVIIAGDRFQLPPTSFFNTTYHENSFDIYNEDFDENYNAFDSILDEATNAIPERTLKWHYRSRYENLIAFSNDKIYKHELTTFPSNIEKMPNTGVEYIYVKDGVYDRGSRKNNIKEAKCVADLVFEHFDHYPNRSLGVVTFSESQQQAIENAIRQRRIANSMYESFFSEDNEEEFFVKNLENVQGDERDTIIFSIGYGKDANGTMYMNFGPLSRNGGYRRLNVAITRAKFNLKLVGSIQPSDINLEKTNSEGVKMLRQYIEYAINGTNYLEEELALTNEIHVESSFEEAIYDFLTRNGFLVKTQVGCSGYRIDMAVKHPTVNGVFVLGIECDGVSYHKARTVRERDRLRQSVLEDMGWKIYRIWSTDWIKDAKIEGEKLLNAIQEAIISMKNENNVDVV
ncbi:very-short-patch-repair endonuclease/disulfide oxidoreductase YuzD [Sedimentibacter acidaminivorans]|uniref:Very-short-patch-repair endonuclease/disulfide oxidoreductase YuzD n=1 Tax=Sedimentibacter acidaminivorans TaxID=913099 RepID=A0ABS4GD29_9FIRM|nr:DUF4011 domain-containing protein [Sedimentibacter acidaminivorans]MBP1925603.1 very-short-patch-repair endonuclease/disulfide oxidoreductase YuzD [Sedimentibacter acidaminivorans]